MRSASRGVSPSAAARCPTDSTLELRRGPLGDELAALAAEGVQSLLLEGGPTLASAFSGKASSTSCSSSSPRRCPATVRPCSAPLAGPLDLLHTAIEPVGE